MTETQKKAVQAKLTEIRKTVAEHECTMTRLRNELLQNAQYFDTYSEMYTFIKANTPTFEAFCKDMTDAMDIFDAAQDKKRSVLLNASKRTS